jgi:16S rRNA (uracil1498-N3)-methyltransferase
VPESIADKICFMPPLRRLLVTPAQLARADGAQVALTPEQARYLVSVLRLAPGDALEIFDGQGARWSALLALDALGAPVLASLEKIERDAEDHAGRASALDVALAQALAKGDKLELVIQKATELGASRVIPFAAERSIVKLDEERGATKVVRWQKIAEEASRQCGRADVPAIDAPRSWGDLFAILADEPARRGVVLDPLATALRLGEAALGADKLLLVVGPEGGFSPDELARAEQHGLMRASLGPLVLRTETAGLAALSVVQHLAGRLG